MRLKALPVIHIATIMIKKTLCCSLILAFIGITTSKSIAAVLATDSLLTKNEVGALKLPATIAPVQAPFKMPKFQKPSFPSFSINIADKGAKQGVSVTGIIQAAIDEVNAKHGGTVIIPAGIWNTGRISLKSNVNLVVSAGAELHFGGELKDYLPAVFTRTEGIEVMSLGAMIYANGQENIAVTGSGKLVGPTDAAIKKLVVTGGVVENIVDYKLPVAQRIYDGQDGRKVYMPKFISPINCKNVYIEGVSLEHSLFWNIVPIYCNNVIIRGVNVNSVGIPAGDGIDIESCTNVLIEYSTLSCGDDCFTIKAGRGDDGIRVNKPTENVVVRYCLAQKGLGGITCGSETAGMIRNVYVHDCVFDNTDIGIRFKTRRGRAGGGENLYYERIRMNLKGAAFTWDMLGSKTYVGELASRMPLREVNKLTPLYRNITARNIVIENTPQFIKLNGIPESPAANILIENAVVNCQKLIALHDVNGITLNNVKINSADNHMDFLDARNVLFKKVSFKNPANNISIKTDGDLTGNIEFKDCTPIKPENWQGPVWQKP